MVGATGKGKDRIRQEALRLFAARGVDAVSVKQIAEAVGMTPPNLYAHYQSRDALVRDLFLTGYAAYAERLREVAAGPGPFRVRLEAMVRLICKLHDEDTDLFRFLMLTQHVNLKGVGANSKDNPVKVVQDFVEAAIGAGEVPASHPATVAAAVIGVVLQAATFNMYGRLGRSMRDAADDIVALCLKVVS